MQADSPTPPDPIRRLHAIVHGRVQGVNFRRQTEDLALGLGLTGFVRNQWDRTVELVAEGPTSRLEQLLAWLHVGPPLAHVTRVDVLWQLPVGNLHGFEVR